MSPHTGSMSPHTGSISHQTASVSRTFSEEKMSLSPAQSPLSNFKVGKNQTVDLVIMIISKIILCVVYCIYNIQMVIIYLFSK